MSVCICPITLSCILLLVSVRPPVGLCSELQHALKQDRDTLQRERQEHIERMAHVQKQSQAVIEQLQRKCQCLTKL